MKTIIYLICYINIAIFFWCRLESQRRIYTEIITNQQEVITIANDILSKSVILDKEDSLYNKEDYIIACKKLYNKYENIINKY